MPRQFPEGWADDATVGRRRETEGSWAIPHYSLDACAARLQAAHDIPQMWPVPIRQRRFLLIATKPQ